MKQYLSFLSLKIFLAYYCIVSFVSICYANDDLMANSGFSWHCDNTSIALLEGNSLVFKFNYAFLEHTNVPKSDPRKFAGDYIYPLIGIDGENLTDNSPIDHYHHHGVFWTWPGVFIHNTDGTVSQYDLWTSNTQIRQRFKNLELLEVTPDKAIMRVENGWYVDGRSTVPDDILDSSKHGFNISENERYYGDMIVSEKVQLTVWPVETVEGVRSRAIDIELVLIPTTRDISLQGAEKKGYGGLTIRFRPRGKIGVDDFITTDEGIAERDMPEKRLRWADYTSRFFEQASENSGKFSGAAIFLSPDFPDNPPTWLTRYYGPLCVGFPGVESQRFEAGKPIIMKARIWIHEGKVSAELLKKIYENYTNQNSCF